MLQAWYAWLAGNPFPGIAYVSAWLQQAMYWLASQLDRDRMRQADGWQANFQSVTMWKRSHDRAMNSIAARLWWLYVRCYIDVPAWLSARIQGDEQWANRWFYRLLADINYVLAMAKWLLHEFSVWLFATTINPILARLKTAEENILRWAYYCYQFVSNPPKLADITFWPLFGVFQKNPFGIGRTIGDWLGKLVYENTVRSISLAEQIITDIL